MQNLLDELVDVLRRDARLVKDGTLFKNKVVELALALDKELLTALLTHKKVKQHFFVDIAGVVVFDKDKFIQFVGSKKFLPDSYTTFKNKIGLTVNGTFISDKNDVVLAWPYKDCVLQGGMAKEDQKRDEVFWNETLAPDDIDRLLDPKVFANFKRFDKGGERDVTSFTGDENLIIKGNNLLALHSLKKRFAGKVKLIYIDPPYNPDSKSNTFCYNNTFNESSWLTFMKNRLVAAKEMLKLDGAMIVAIDENEHLELGLLLKEIFKGWEIHCITIVHNPRGVQGTNFSYTHEYAFFVIPANKKTIGNKKIETQEVDWSPLRNWGGESLRTDAKNCFYPIIVEDGTIVGFGDVVDSEVHPKSQTVRKGNQSLVYPFDKNDVERKWRYARQSIEEVKHLLRAKKTKNGYEIEIGKDFGTYRTVWSDPRYDANEYGTKLVKALVPGCTFDFPKSLWNVYDCVHAVVAEDTNAIVLDFFAGSGTTAHAVLELNKDGGNRRFILCEQMHYVESVTRERVKKVIEQNGGGSFVYCELMQWNQAFVERIRAAKTKPDLKTIWEAMKNKAFFSYRVDPKMIDERAAEYDALTFVQQQQFLYECLDKNQLYVNYSEIDDTDYGVRDADKKLNRQFYGKDTP